MTGNLLSLAGSRAAAHVAAVFFAALCLSPAFAQTAGASSSSIARGIDRLAVLGSVLYVAAHPDDENTQVLAWLAQHRHYRVGYLSLTRGDGGQNLIGPEAGDSLGLIRTHEILAARRVDGAEQFFTRARDFGYSKTLEESLAVWGHEQTLADVVRVIRRFRPDVIVTRFPADERAGHGHHQASSRLAQEAFVAAADPTRFPEQLKTLQPWQAKRIVWNTWPRFLASGDTRSEDQLKIDVGGYDPLLGASAGETAALSRDSHKSQGFGSAARRGRLVEYFAPLAGTAARGDLLDDVDTSWHRVGAGAAVIAERIAALRKHYDFSDPSASVPDLLALRTAIAALPEGQWRAFKFREVEGLIVAAAGLRIETAASAAILPPGRDVPVRTDIVVRSRVPVHLLGIAQTGVAGATDEAALRPLPPNEPVSIPVALTLDRISQPYWLARAHDAARFEAADDLVGEPVNPDPVSVDVRLLIAGTPLTLTSPVIHKVVDPVRGEVYRPLIVAPAVTATPVDPVRLFPDGEKRSVSFRLRAFSEYASGVIRLRAGEGWSITPAERPFVLKGSGDEQVVSFEVTPPRAPGRTVLAADVRAGDVPTDRAWTPIDYPHIPGLGWFPDASLQLVRLDVNMAGRRIGYIPGAGDEVAPVLRQLGYAVEELDTARIDPSTLGRFDAIVTGIRAYNVDARLKALHARLLEYAAAGGVLLVQYNTTTALGVEALGPYPFRIGRDRVTDESAEVGLPAVRPAVLDRPNRIGHADFDGWVQERGLYFATDIDPRYVSPLRMHDSGEPALTGGLIVADHGRGRFVYAPLSFFRQLPAGVPGAIRLFANLLAKP